MRLYYTVITEEEAIQSRPSYSLGGYKSQSKLVNGQIGNLFSDISNTTISTYNQNQYIGLVLRNELSIQARNIKLWFVYPDKCYSKFRLAAVDMALDSKGVQFMENIQTLNEKPIAADFYEADGELNKLNIGDLGIGEKVGIWVERELLLDFIKEDQMNIYTNDPAKQGRYIEVPLGKEDDIGIGISWD